MFPMIHREDQQKRMNKKKEANATLTVITKFMLDLEQKKKRKDNKLQTMPLKTCKYMNRKEE